MRVSSPRPLPRTWRTPVGSPIEACAKDFAKAGNEAHKGCATGCLNGGDAVALASPDGFHLLDITTEAALEHLGMEVTVMGTLDEATNTIKVTSINASS